DVSLVDLTCVVERATTVEEVNAAFRGAATGGPLQGLLAVSEEPLVSVDYIGNLMSSTVDLLSTQVIDGTLVHLASWYDHEMGYSARCAHASAPWSGCWARRWCFSRTRAPRPAPPPPAGCRGAPRPWGRTPGSIRAKRPTTRSWPGGSPRWATSTSTTPSARPIAPMP